MNLHRISEETVKAATLRKRKQRERERIKIENNQNRKKKEKERRLKLLIEQEESMRKQKSLAQKRWHQKKQTQQPNSERKYRVR